MIERFRKLSKLRSLLLFGPRGVGKSTLRIPAKEKLSSFYRIADEFTGSEKFVLSNAKEERVVNGVRHLHWRTGLEDIFGLGR